MTVNDRELLRYPPKTFQVLEHGIGWTAPSRVQVTWKGGATKIVRTNGDEAYESLMLVLDIGGAKETHA